jgi:hypothetical protein
MAASYLVNGVSGAGNVRLAIVLVVGSVSEPGRQH